MSLSEADVAVVLEEEYTSENVIPDMIMRSNPTLAMITHSYDGSGDTRRVPIKIARPQGRGTDYATAAANATGTNRVAFSVPYFDHYQVVEIDGPVMARTAGQRVYAIDHVRTEMDGGIATMGDDFSRQLWGNGGGARGQDDGTWVSGNVITLANVADAINFEVGQVLKSSTTDGTSGAVKSGSVTVTDVNRITGDITVDAIGGIPTFAASDYLFVESDFGLSMQGWGAWIPATDPTATLFNGVDRTSDIERLSGFRYDASADTTEEGMIKLRAKIANLHSGVKPDLCPLHPENYAALVIALGDRKRYVQASGSGDFKHIDFEAIQMAHGIKVYEDPNAPKDYISLMNSESWVFETCNGKMVDVLSRDGRKVRYRDGSDTLNIRLYTLGNFYCKAPGGNGRANLT